MAPLRSATNCHALGCELAGEEAAALDLAHASLQGTEKAWGVVGWLLLLFFFFSPLIPSFTLLSEGPLQLLRNYGLYCIINDLRRPGRCRFSRREEMRRCSILPAAPGASGGAGGAEPVPPIFSSFPLPLRGPKSPGTLPKAGVAPHPRGCPQRTRRHSNAPPPPLPPPPPPSLTVLRRGGSRQQRGRR